MWQVDMRSIVFCIRDCLLCCWMFQLLVLLTMTVMIAGLGFDVAGVVSYLHLFILWLGCWA